MKIITLTTDIGWFYAAQMKAKILSINGDARIVDITHSIHPQNILEGAYALYSSVIHFPEAIHIAVVDPEVGTERRPIIVETKKGYLVGPDNGILIPAASRLGIKNVYEIKEKKYMAEKISNTFHGRDIFSPVAAHLSLGVMPYEIGEKIEDYKNLDFGGMKEGEIISGKVIFIDRFGNIITNIPDRYVKWKHGDWVGVRLSGKALEIKFLKSYGYAEKGEMLLTVSSSNFLEISCRDGNAHEMLGAEIGDTVEILGKV
jgi:S-adenosylmethionine hydrolase